MAKRVLTDYTDPIPEPLLHALEQDRLVAFIGAGTSRRCYSKTRAPLPDWPALLGRLVEWAAARQVFDAQAVDDLQELLRHKEFLMVAQECREQVGDDQLAEFLADVFNPDGVVPARVHELLSAIPFRGYVTTNYDNLLERAHVRVHKRQLCTVFPETVGGAFERPQRNRPLLKLHGDVDVPASIVLGHRDYLRMIWTHEYAEFMRGLMANFTLLFVGYRLADSDVLLPLDQLAHEGVKCRHYLLSQQGAHNA
ncbi:MAG: SIR2 family protein, partial [Planctomycetes bacterium]|nr:SIR2 family protein [Planctomycetota bacterium]